MSKLTLSALIKQRGFELADLYLSELEVFKGRVTANVGTYVIDTVQLTYAADAPPHIVLDTTHLVSEVEAQEEYDAGASSAMVDAMQLMPQAATIVLASPDNTLWFRIPEDDENTCWCIHSPYHPVLPGHIVPQLD
ncbi:MAG TPA: hypothetical protein VD907_06015 [Verrucomicrobiae bacterium]|nr:hypothetical protein [Verrucomicrobiae bacterium]